MIEPAALRSSEPQPAPRVESPPASYAGRTRYTQLEYEAALANASIGIAFTRDRKFFLCNPKFEEMFGWGPEELIGQSGEAVYPSHESYAALGQIAIPILTSGKQLDIEWEMRRKDGTSFLARVIAKAIDTTVTQQGTIWIVEDITERKRQSDEMNRLLREQEAILGTASVGIVFIKERRIVRCNRRYEEMYGSESGTLVGQPVEVLYADERAFADAEAAYEQLAKGHTSRRIEMRRRNDGSTFWVRTDGRAVDPRYPERGSVWTVEDITEQLRAEENLASLLAEQQALLNNVVAGIAFVRDRRLQRCNRRFEELFGFGAGEALNASMRALYFTDEEFEARATAYRELDEGHPHQREQFLRRVDGSGFWCRLSGRAVEAGNPDKGYVWLFEDITEQKRADEAMRRLTEDQQLILDNATVGITFVRDRVIQRCNRRLEEMTGRAPGELIGRSSEVLFASQEEWKAINRAAYEGTAPGETYDEECFFRRADGSTFYAHSVGRRIDSGAGEQQEWIWIIEDATERHEAEERVRRALAEQELILDNATVGISFIRQRVYQRCNPRLEEMFGYGPGELIGQPSSLLFLNDEEYADVGRRVYGELRAGRAFADERRLKRKDGSTLWCKVVGRAIDTAHPEEGAIWIYDDITAERESREALEASRDALERAVTERTAELKAANERLEGEIGERKQAEKRAQHLADHDALTGLPNRRLLEDRLTQALALSYRNRKQTAVMFVDLDRFKNINDSLGHAVGDMLLKEIARRLVAQLRVGDTICRIGGDEFVVVLPESKRSTDAANVAQKVIEQLSLPIDIEGRELHVTPSIGISVFPDDGRDAETLIRNADAAMYHAKEMGRANYQFFTDQMNLSASRRLALENDLRRAIQKGELRVHYQPIVELGGGHVAAHEALVRWQHPSRGLVSPAEFIQLAEDTGLILKIGEWVLREACRWATFIGVDRGLPVSVNLSPRQFNDPRLVETIASVLSESGLPARLLELEITETTAMQQTDVTLATLGKLKKLGVSIAIDDFGTGYSSLAYLKRFPVDKLKIDRAFIAEVPADKDAKAIVAATVALAHALGLKVVAEGVETEAQLEFLQTCRCDFLQGYIAGKPVDPDTAAKEYV